MHFFTNVGFCDSQFPLGFDAELPTDDLLGNNTDIKE
jgi:hypothetical protein